MRHLLLVLCSLLVLLPSALADTVEDIAIPANCLAASVMDAAPGSMTDRTVIDMTLQALLAHHPEESAALLDLPYDAHAWPVQLTNGQTAWIGTVFTQQGETPIEAALTVDPSTQAVLRYEENGVGWFCETQARWEAVHGPYGSWSLEAQYLFDVLYCTEVTHALPEPAFYPLDSAYAAALEAADLTASRDTISFERALIHNLYAADSTAQYIWMITLTIDGQPLAQINLSAIDGHVIDVFDYRDDVG